MLYRRTTLLNYFLTDVLLSLQQLWLYQFKHRAVTVFPHCGRSYSYKDELVWGAVWLYRATGNKTYLNTAEQLYKDLDILYMVTGFTWDAKVSGVEVSGDGSPTNKSL